MPLMTNFIPVWHGCIEHNHNHCPDCCTCDCYIYSEETSMPKIKINKNPVANHYAGPNEKIIEYSSEKGGGLISFTQREDGTLSVHLYRHDATVTITVEEQP